nr:MAG TPA_asm: hypothetical protein [Caudoviricetes sp.]
MSTTFKGAEILQQSLLSCIPTKSCILCKKCYLWPS